MKNKSIIKPILYLMLFLICLIWDICNDYLLSITPLALTALLTVIFMPLLTGIIAVSEFTVKAIKKGSPTSDIAVIAVIGASLIVLTLILPYFSIRGINISLIYRLFVTPIIIIYWFIKWLVNTLTERKVRKEQPQS